MKVSMLVLAVLCVGLAVGAVLFGLDRASEADQFEQRARATAADAQELLGSARLEDGSQTMALHRAELAALELKSADEYRTMRTLSFVGAGIAVVLAGLFVFLGLGRRRLARLRAPVPPTRT